MPEDRKYSPNPKPADWRQLAQQVATETDPEKLSQLIDELCHALEKARRQNPPQSDRSKPESPSRPHG